MAAKNTINLISILAIWWYPCVELPLGLLEKGVCYDQCILLTKLCYPLPWFILYSKAKLAYYSWCLLTSYFCISILYDEKDISFLMLALDGVVGLHRTGRLQFLQHQWLGHRLGLLSRWMVCLGNEVRSFCYLQGCTQVLNFRLFCWLLGLFHFF